MLPESYKKFGDDFISSDGLFFFVNIFYLFFRRSAAMDLYTGSPFRILIISAFICFLSANFIL